MTGPEHYRESERLLEEADEYACGCEAERSLFAEAQVHAILALTAATVDAAAHPNQSAVDYLGPWWGAQDAAAVSK